MVCFLLQLWIMQRNKVVGPCPSSPDAPHESMVDHSGSQKGWNNNRAGHGPFISQQSYIKLETYLLFSELDSKEHGQHTTARMFDFKKNTAVFTYVSVMVWRFQNLLMEHPQNHRLQNVQNIRIPKRPVSKTSGYQNVRFSKRPVFKTSDFQKVGFLKRPVFKTSGF